MLKLFPDGFDYSWVTVPCIGDASTRDQVDENISIRVFNVYTLGSLHEGRSIISF